MICEYSNNFWTYFTYLETFNYFRSTDEKTALNYLRHFI